MPEIENSVNVLSGKDAFIALSETVEELKKASTRLLDAMEDQIGSVISSDAELMIQTTEQNVTEQQNFFNAEQELIKALACCIPDTGQRKQGISFELLKVYLPGKARQLEAWKQDISDTIDMLQVKQGQLVELLEFAQSRNADMMRSLYGLKSAKHTHYHHNGEKSGLVSGMALNQEG